MVVDREVVVRQPNHTAIQPYSHHPSFYSLRSDFTGLARAARMAW